MVGFGVGEKADYHFEDLRIDALSVMPVTVALRYHYDTRGWVVGRTLNPGTPEEELLFYVYDGARIAEQVDGDGDLVAAWDYGTYIDEPVAMHRDTDGDGVLDATWYYLQDDLYNVVGLVDAATGQVVERYTYDDYGTPTVWVEDGENPGTWVENTTANGAPASAIGNPFLFTGRRWDPQLQLYDYRTRYYDPALGRFLRIDTIGLYGDPANLGNPYTYVGNNPWSGTDPWGELSNSVFAAWREEKESNKRLKEAFSGAAPEVGERITAQQIAAATRARRARQNHVRAQFRQEIRAVGGYEGDFYQDAADAQNFALNEIQKRVAITAGAVGLAASGPTLATAAAVADAGNAAIYAARDDRGMAIATGTAAALGLTAAAGMARADDIARTGDAAGDLGRTGGNIEAGSDSVRLLTGSDKVADHHIFPQEFRGWFQERGVQNIDNFTITVDQDLTHLRAIHGSGNMSQMPGRWNAQWAEFIRNNPKATSREVYQQAGRMMDDFGIGHIPIHPYKAP